MFAGHFALAAAVRAKQSSVPLWGLMLGTQLLDLAFVPLLLSGVETMEPVSDGGYGDMLIHADYTHSLVGALFIACVAGFMAKRAWGRRGGEIMASLVFSHWLLDLLVHRADLPILPGNLGNLPLLGLGLWTSPAASIAVETIMIAVGGYLYFRSVIARERKGSGNSSQRNGRGLTAGIVMSVLLVMSLFSDLL